MMAKSALGIIVIGLFCSLLTNPVCSIEPENVVGIWLFDDGEEDIAVDSSGGGHDGQILNNAQRVEGRFGGALKLSDNGESSYVRIPHGDDLNLAEHSITAWIKMAAVEVMPTESPWQLLIGKWQSHNVRNYGIMTNRNSGAVLAQFTSGGARQYKGVMGTGLTYEEWHHIACTYDGEAIKVYVDGIMEAEMATSTCPDMGPGDLNIGAGPAGMHPTAGIIDDVGLFKVALEQGEIEKIMANGLQNALKPSVTGTTTGSVDEVVEKAVEKALEKAFEKSAAEEQENGTGSVQLNGVLESEFSHVMAEGDNENDFALATVELGADMSLGPNVDGHLVFLYEQGENDDNIAVDTGTIDLGLSTTTDVDLSLSFGLMCVPFGEFNSHFIADPYTCDIGETSQLALQLSASHKILHASAAIYNEEINVTGDTNGRISDIAVRLAASAPDGTLGDGVSLLAGTSFITNMAGTDGLTDMIDDGEVLKRAAGLGGFISFSAMGLSLDGEIVQTLDHVLLPDGDGTLKPRAINMELGYSLPETPVSIAGRFEQLSENGDDSTNRFGGIIALGLFSETASLALEFLRTENNETEENTIVTQLAVEF